MQEAVSDLLDTIYANDGLPASELAELLKDRVPVYLSELGFRPYSGTYLYFENLVGCTCRAGTHRGVIGDGNAGPMLRWTLTKDNISYEVISDGVTHRVNIRGAGLISIDNADGKLELRYVDGYARHTPDGTCEFALEGISGSFTDNFIDCTVHMESYYGVPTNVNIKLDNDGNVEVHVYDYGGEEITNIRSRPIPA
jgi:hypothetical protein